MSHTHHVYSPPYETALRLVNSHKGIRGSRLVAELVVIHIDLEPKFLRDIPANLVADGALVEIEYMLPFETKSDSLFLPAGTKIMGTSNG